MKDEYFCNRLYTGTKTGEMLRIAFEGEVQARTKYTFFASVAKKEGYEQIADIFQETAENEKEHAKIWYKELYGLGTTEENLTDAVEHENFEWSCMYKEFAQTAQEEGFYDLAEKFRRVALIEQYHEERFKKLLENIRKKEVFERDEEKVWVCRNCGRRVIAREAPQMCDTCDHPQAYYELCASNY